MFSLNFSSANFKNDFLAGIVVFLVALPLCLGIALASNAPIISGLITGIIAGIVVSLFSGSEMSVSGPAAGLTVIVASAISKLGGFEVFVGAVVLGGVFQILLGLLRAGGLSVFFPNSVIHGMLAAIGISIILKQIPHGLGRDTDYEGNLDFWNFTDRENTVSELLLALQSISPLALFICLGGIALFLLWPRVQAFHPILQSTPAALVVVIAGLLVNEAAGFVFPSLQLSGNHLVDIPQTGGLGFLWERFQFPSLDILLRSDILIVAVTLALVGSIESLLCVEATDKLDTEGRISDTNKELFAQGLGNILCGLFGGLPMTSVIVRSSTNIYAGAKSRFSAFFHGVFLLICVVFLSNVLNRIPLSALAAVLVVIGYKLSSITIFKRVFSMGIDQFVPFLVTLGTTIFTDLLTGVIVGLIVAFLILIKTSVYGAIVAVQDGKNFYIQFTKDVSFSNKGFLRKVLLQIPSDCTVFIDGTRAMFIDHDIYEMLNDFTEKASGRNIDVELIEIRGKSYQLVTRKRRKIHAEIPKSAPNVQ